MVGTAAAAMAAANIAATMCVWGRVSGVSRSSIVDRRSSIISRCGHWSSVVVVVGSFGLQGRRVAQQSEVKWVF